MSIEPKHGRTRTHGIAALLAFGLLGGGLAGGCSKQGGSTGPKRDLSGFACNDRQVGYMVAGGFAADEAGITMQCTGDDPQIIRWRLEETGRQSKKKPLSAEQFDAVWAKVDATGWRFLEEDCNNPSKQDGDPVYVIDVSDDSMSKTLHCDGKVLPFPYDRIVNELDLRAAGFGDQDDEVR
jgi:hypothetical protein